MRGYLVSNESPLNQALCDPVDCQRMAWAKS